VNYLCFTEVSGNRNRETFMARDQNTFAKRRREMEKKRKAEEKRERRRRKKEQADAPTEVAAVEAAEDPVPESG
jgi:hypothetical protein